MKVRELIELLKVCDPDAEVLTNECEASSTHEEIVPLEKVEYTGNTVFVGT